MNSTRADFAATMESLGERLKKIREEKGISLEHAQSETKIHSRVLTAIEEDRIAEELSPIYVKSFLKTYARYLGLETESIIRDYLVAAPPPSQLVLRIDRKRRTGSRRQVIFIVKIVLICILTLAFIVYIRFIMQHLFHSRQRPRPAIAKPNAEAPVKMFPIPLDQPLKLTVSTKEDSWMQIKSDGKLIFQNVLSKGNIEKWEAGEKLELWVGNAAALQFDLNGRDLGSPGRGVIKDIVITREGMKVGKR